MLLLFGFSLLMSCIANAKSTSALISGYWSDVCFQAMSAASSSFDVQVNDTASSSFDVQVNDTTSSSFEVQVNDMEISC